MSARTCILLLAVATWALEAGAAVSSIVPSPPVCDGETATTRCNVADGTSTRWTIDGVGADCTLLHGVVNDTQQCGDFFGRLLSDEIVGNCVPSELSVSVTAAINGAMVTCKGFDGPMSSTIGSAVVQVVGPPSPPLLMLDVGDIALDPSDASSRLVTIRWSLTADQLSSFIVSVSPAPAVGSCGASCRRPGTEVSLQFSLSVNSAHNFTVRGESCGDTLSGAESEVLSVDLKVPPAPSTCSGVPVYTQPSNLLTKVETTWSAVQGPFDVIAPSISGDVTSYQVTVQPASGSQQIPPTSCLSASCKQTVSVGGVAATSPYAVSVVAENVVGQGATQQCGAFSATNNLIKVTINARSPTDVMAECQFLSGFIGTTRCVIRYGTDPTFVSLSFTNESSTSAAAGGTVSVSLSQPLDPTITYFFAASSVGGGSPGVVQGTFSSVCSAGELGSPSAGTGCPSGQTEIVINNGTGCYNALTPDSVATYTCAEGFELVGSSRRECMADGHWSGAVPSCSPVEQPSSSSGFPVWIIAVIAGGGGLLIFLLVAAIIVVCFFMCSKKNKGDGVGSDGRDLELQFQPQDNNLGADSPRKHVVAPTAPWEEAEKVGHTPFENNSNHPSETRESQLLSSESEEQPSPYRLPVSTPECEPSRHSGDTPSGDESAAGTSSLGGGGGGGGGGGEEELGGGSVGEGGGEAGRWEPEERQRESPSHSVASNVSKSSLEDPSSPTRAGVYNLHSQDSGEGQRDGQFRVNGVSRGSSELGPPEAVLNGAGVVAGEEDVDTAPLVPPKHRKPPTPPQPYRDQRPSRKSSSAMIQSSYCVAMNYYISAVPSDMCLEAGEIVKVIDNSDNRWWQGISAGKKGFFPAANVLGLNDGDTIMRARCDYHPRSPTGFDLEMKKAQIIIVDGTARENEMGLVPGKSLDRSGAYVQGNFPEEFAEKLQTIHF